MIGGDTVHANTGVPDGAGEPGDVDVPRRIEEKDGPPVEYETHGRPGAIRRPIQDRAGGESLPPRSNGCNDTIHHGLRNAPVRLSDPGGIRRTTRHVRRSHRCRTRKQIGILELPLLRQVTDLRARRSKV
jgi:hypothetical protein